MAQPTAQTDRDLTSIHEARTLVHLRPVEGLRLAGEHVLVEVDLLAARPQGVEVGRGGVGARDQDVPHGVERGQQRREQTHQ